MAIAMAITTTVIFERFSQGYHVSLLLANAYRGPGMHIQCLVPLHNLNAQCSMPLQRFGSQVLATHRGGRAAAAVVVRRVAAACPDLWPRQ
eukprot:99858-Pelagomonas_calceolata.AAC.2